MELIRLKILRYIRGLHDSFLAISNEKSNQNRLLSVVSNKSDMFYSAKAIHIVENANMNNFKVGFYSEL